MRNIKITLHNNKKYNAENIDDVQVLEDENNATTIEVQFPIEYENYSKRVDFLNVRGEKWTTSLYAPEDERNAYDENFDKLNFRFTIPSSMAKRGELKVQFVAYLADGMNTIVPFQILLLSIDNSIIYATKEGKENPEIIIRAYEYSNMALEISRDAFSRIENAERAALSAEESAISAQNSATSAQNSATNAENSSRSANERAQNAEESAESAQASAEYAESVADEANAKSTNAVNTSNSANTKSDNAVATANSANTKSTNAVNTANTANTKSDNAVATANSANTKSDTAISTADEAKATAQEALNQVVKQMGTKVYFGDNTEPETNVLFDSDPQTQITANETEITKIKEGTTRVPKSSEAQKLMSSDNRDVNTLPSGYMSNNPKQIITEFKNTSTIGVNSILTASTYCQLITIVPWTDSSGGYPTQLAFNGSGIAYRIGTADDTWGSWNKLSTVAELTARCDNLQTQINNMLNGTTTFTLLKANVVDLV